MDLPKLQALIAPLATPVTPALLLGNEMYQVMKAVQIHWLLALVGAITAIVGLEFSGALASYMAVKAWNHRDWGAMLVSVLGVVFYTAIVIGGILIMPQQRAQVFAVMVFATLVAYIGYALYHSYSEQARSQQDTTTTELELLRLQKQLTNAQTRQIKATGQVSSAVHLTLDKATGQVDNVTEIGQKVIDYFGEHPDASLRTVSAEVGCSPETVRQWKKVFEATND